MSVLVRLPLFEIHNIKKIEPGIVIFCYNKEQKYADMHIVVSKIKRDDENQKYFLSLWPYGNNCPQRCWISDFGIRPYGRNFWNPANKRTYKVPLLKISEDKLEELVLEAIKEWKEISKDFQKLKPFREAFKSLQI